MHGSIRPFQFGLPRDIKLTVAKTTKDQTIPKRTESAFIEPMQCKSVTALPAGEKWSFEIKFDGYRCIAVKRGSEVTLFSRHKKELHRRFSSIVQALASPKGDFVLDGELVAMDPQGNPSSQLLQTNLSQSLPLIFTPSITEPKNGGLFVILPFCSGGRCWKASLPPRIRCACLHCCRRIRGGS